MRQPTNKQSGKAALQSLVILMLFLVAIVAVLYNRQSINDYWQLKNYQPSAEIATIATQDSLTDYGRRILYVNHPQIYQKTAFGKYCPDDSTKEQTIVLGCYHGNQSGVFLLNVTEPRLNGVKQVTTAHEMLHAAYDRLSSQQRRSVDNQLMAYYKNDLKDKRLLSTIEAYKKSEPGDVVNEMHSIFGTEVATLPPSLEQYYAKYFVNRSQVTALSAGYQAEFTSRQAKVAAADAELNSLKIQIDEARASLNARQAEITSKQAALLAQRNGGDISGYNAGVPVYNGLVSDYNNQVQNVRAMVARYNQLVEDRNAIALEEDQLIKSLSAQVSPINN